ncbi:DNA-binding transcriptional LysR family regulator [Acetoanaerobium pronyense]|uniref:DNA-binding transcriptional LysR family regulator n=1 Tax=Acetoanaerobium pronyense TaxID=1482736 RepID=A0ABS4KLH6_9FIRM|nr:LysR family transcriptional regulator [Acetoanaerobium pronyense]MBP2028610.1 DNA-binding transcriptional LysR family regulator [Acetoanaerobium pronyense]
MAIKLDLYKVFCEVAKCGSFSKAAKELYMTQPAVSQSIMQLERELQVRLFTRMPKGVALTNEGELLFEYINSAMNLIGTGEKKLKETKGMMIGELKIGVGDTISRYFLMPYLEMFHRKYPNIKLKIINRTTLELCDMLKSGEIDIAICNLPIDDSAIESKPCLTVQDIFVCGEQYKDLAKNPIDILNLSSLPLILLEGKSNTRKYIEKYFLENGVKITPEIELGSHDLLLEFAKINLGIACVIREFSHDYMKDGSLYEIKLKEEIPNRSIGFCYLKSVSLSVASRKFVEIVESKEVIKE